MTNCTYIDHLKKNEISVWLSIKSAAEEGLIIIDEENDAITATNRLLLTYPGLHEILSYLNNEWVEKNIENMLSKIITEEPCK